MNTTKIYQDLVAGALQTTSRLPGIWNSVTEFSGSMEILGSGGSTQVSSDASWARVEDIEVMSVFISHFPLVASYIALLAVGAAEIDQLDDRIIDEALFFGFTKATGLLLVLTMEAPYRDRMAEFMLDSAAALKALPVLELPTVLAEAKKFGHFASGFRSFSPFDLLASADNLGFLRMDMTLAYLDYCVTREIFAIDEWLHHCPMLVARKMAMHTQGPDMSAFC